MATNSFVKSAKIVNTALGLLVREQVLLGLVTPYTRTDFQYTQNDTISVPVRAITQARSFALRAQGEARRIVVDTLTETTVPVKLDTVVYNAISIQDEEATLDLADFSTQVLAPQVLAVTEQIEEMVYDGMASAPYAAANQFAWDAETSGAYKMAARARKVLDKANVPTAGRTLLIGPDSEEAILVDSKLEPGPNPTGLGESALRDATIGRLAGFTIVKSNLIPAGEIYAFHKTAYAFGNAAPVVPQGAKTGAIKSYNGVSLRWLMDYSADYGTDRSVLTTYAGANATIDPHAANKVVRAVKISVTGTDSDLGAPAGG